MRFRFIEDRRSDYPVRTLCEVLEVSPAGYYAWRSRPESQRSAANRELVDDIRRVHRDACGRYGSPRIHRELKDQGRGVSRGRIERLGCLNEFWGSRKLSEVTGVTCREYVRWRGSDGGARRDLEDLRAAIERAYTAVDKIHFEGMHFRRDIGAKGLRRLSVPPEDARPPRRGQGLRGPMKL